MLKIQGERRTDYFHIICQECGKHVDITYRGYCGGAVPKIRISCETCGESIDLKLSAPHWSGLPFEAEQEN